ncbi:MAG: type II secretion system F family protein [Desulfobacterium sp.]|nr:type II secretion system F family protein [Desulfobacterium sp.]
MAIEIQTPKIQPTKKSAPTGFRQSVKPKEMTFFLSQLAMMLEVGIPLSQSMETIAKQVTNPVFSRTIAAMKTDIDEGQQLSVAMGHHPKVFKAVFVNMVRSGESGGFLTDVIGTIIKIQEKQQAIRTEIRTAITYPAVLLSMALVVTVFILVLVVPKFAIIFENNLDLLPLTTQWMMGLSSIMISHGWAFLLLGLVGATALKRYLSSNRGALFVDWILINTPVLSDVTSKLYTGLFFQTMGSVLKSRVPLVEALDIAGATISNRYYSRFVKTIQTQVEGGGNFALGFAANPHVQDSIKQMIHVGETVGKLPAVMLRLADFYESEIEHDLKRFTSLIEPVALVLMGGVVWVIVSSIILPMFKIASTVR